MKTLFEKIDAGEIPAEKVYENEHVFAIKDIAPKAPIHILIITKKPIYDIQSIKKEEFFLLGEVIKAAQHIARSYEVVETGYRLVVNKGEDAGQTIFHLHFHFLAGETLGDMV